MTKNINTVLVVLMDNMWMKPQHDPFQQQVNRVIRPFFLTKRANGESGAIEPLSADELALFLKPLVNNLAYAYDCGNPVANSFRAIINSMANWSPNQAVIIG